MPIELSFHSNCLIPAKSEAIIYQLSTVISLFCTCKICTTTCMQCCKVKEGYLFQKFFLHFQEHAFESSQKYKEGKFIIELAHMIKDNGWA